MSIAILNFGNPVWTCFSDLLPWRDFVISGTSVLGKQTEIRTWANVGEV
jgi:hypothetical protein